jgi:cell division septum initiation protein DivIVA
MEFLKLKLQEEHTEQHQHSPLLQEIEDLRRENEQMREELAGREADLKELERRVKESLIAMDEFRREAVLARTDLIHKESELSLISKQAKQLDPAECIQELYR